MRPVPCNYYVIQQDIALSRRKHGFKSRVDRAFMRSVIEVKTAHGDDQRDRYRVAVLWHLLARLEPEPDHAHRPAVRDLFESERPMGPARANR